MNQDIKNKQAWWMPAVIIFTRISAWIVFPVIIALFIGKGLDTYFSTGQTLFIVCMILSFIVSATAIIKISKSYIKKLEEETRNKLEQNNVNKIN
jgi:F0F1-type ATP synthase assembly protein I